MKFLKLIGLVTFFLGPQAFADSQYLDSARLKNCGGRVELRKASNGDLAIHFEGLNERRCWNLRFYDYSSGRTIKNYPIEGTSYTLSQNQKEHLSSDCKLGFTVSGLAQDDFTLTLGWWRCQGAGEPHSGGGSSSRYSFQWSNAGFCKLFVNGDYINRTVPDDYCAGAHGKQFVSYEYSNRHNCKRMIDGQYSGRNVADTYCRARF